MISLFITSLIGLCVAAIAAFIVAFKRRSLLLTVFVPLIALCGSGICFSYISVIGYPLEAEWTQLPDKITVIYFRVLGKDSITLWIIDGNTTRLIKLPYIKPAEDGLEAGRKSMGKGTPVTYKRMGKKGKGKGKKGDGEPGEGDGENGDGDRSGRQGKKGKGKKGWRYEIDSFGDPIPGGALPPKT